MNQSERVRVHVWVSGRVQGVFFRQETADRAYSTGLDGWVRNTEDGRVEAVFEGDRPGVESLIEWCHRGPALAHVTDVEVLREKPKWEGSFHVRP